MTKAKSTAGKFILNMLYQIIPVMIGVYLGFAVNNRGERIKVKKDKAVYEKMLYNEIYSNLNEVKKVFPYHQTLKKNFTEIILAESPLKALNDYSFTGLRTPRLNQGAYDTGIQTGILKEFDLQFVQMINQMYSVQKSKVSFNQDILSSMISKDLPNNDLEANNLTVSTIINLNDIIAGEQDLQIYYCEILNNFFQEFKNEFDEDCDYDFSN